MPRMHDVARRAGVSVSTVSYALSGMRPISEETRQRIYAAMEQLGYQPHALARGLASKRSRIIALLYPPVNRTIGATELGFVTSVTDAARALGYSVLLSTIELHNLEDLRQLTQQGLVDGAVVMEIHQEDARIALLQELGFPFSMVGHNRDNDRLSFVDIDFQQTARRGVEYLTSLGHQRLAFLNFAPEVVASGYGPAVRLQAAFEESLKLFKVRGTSHACEPTPNAGYELTYRLLGGKRPCTALIVFNERVLPGVMQAVEDRGLRVPDDLSLVAVSSPAIAELFRPVLTTLDVPAADMGRIGVEILIRQLEGVDQEPTHLLLPCRLVVRQSSGPCHRCTPASRSPLAARDPSPAPA